MSSESDRKHLWTMAEVAQRAVTQLGTKSLLEFQRDVDLYEATLRRVEVIGEAASRIRREGGTAPASLPLQVIISMRNILAHRYDGVDPELVYETVRHRLPLLIAAIRAAAGPVPDHMKKETQGL